MIIGVGGALVAGVTRPQEEDITATGGGRIATAAEDAHGPAVTLTETALVTDLRREAIIAANTTVLNIAEGVDADIIATSDVGVAAHTLEVTRARRPRASVRIGVGISIHVGIGVHISVGIQVCIGISIRVYIPIDIRIPVRIPARIPIDVTV